MGDRASSGLDHWAEETEIMEEMIQMLEGLYDHVNLIHATALYHYAKEAEGGAIVELGAGRGKCAIVLALGTRAGAGLKVYAIDAYTKRRGPYGEPYGPQDKQVFFKNIAAAGVDVELIEMDIDEAFVFHEYFWKQGLSLVSWDIGGNRIGHDFSNWSRVVVPGGFFLSKNTYNPFGSEPVILKALDDGSWSRLPDMMSVSIIVKYDEDDEMRAVP